MWKFYSVFAAILVGFNNILYKHGLKLDKHEYTFYGCLITIGVGICGLIYLTAANKIGSIKKVSPYRWAIVALISICFFSGIIIFYNGLPLSPNMSMNASLFAGGKIATVLLITCLVFKKPLTTNQMLSLFIILAGIGVLGLGH